MACCTNCPTQSHESFGACMRAKRVQIDQHSLKIDGANLDKQRDHTLARFRQCVQSGVTPQKPTLTEVEKAERKLNSA